MNSCGGQTIPELGALHRATIWENMVLNVALSHKGIPQTTPAQSPLGGTPNISTTNLVDTSSSLNSGTNVANGIQPTGEMRSSREEITNPKQDETPLSRNAAALKYLTHGMPNVLAPFFQGPCCLAVGGKALINAARQRSSKCSMLAVIQRQRKRNRFRTPPISLHVYY